MPWPLAGGALSPHSPASPPPTETPAGSDGAKPAPPPALAPRSLWLIRGDEGYGVRRAMLGMAGDLTRRGVTVAFVAFHPGSCTDAVAAAGYPCWLLRQAASPAAIRQRGWRFLSGVARLCGQAATASRALEPIIRRFQPDWLHVRINTLVATAGLAGRRTGIPVYWHLPNTIGHKLPFRLQALGTQLLCRLLRIQVLANSRHTAASLGSALCRPRVLYPGIDCTHFSPSASFARVFRSDLALDPGVPVAVIAARVVPAKAQDRVLEAAIQLHAAGHGFALLIVGGPTDTPYYAALRQRIEMARAERYVRLIGPVSDPRPYFQLADFVINSRIDAEPFGLTVVEAMLMERPVLAYGLGGPAETIDDDITGWLIHDASVEGYTLGILRALRARSSWREMGHRARVHAQACFSVRQTVHRYLELVGAGQPLS